MAAASTKIGWVAFYEAVKSGDLNSVKVHLDQKEFDFRLPLNMSQNSLTVAAMNGQTDVIGIILNHAQFKRLRPLDKRAFILHVLCEACSHNLYELVQFLFSVWTPDPSNPKEVNTIYSSALLAQDVNIIQLVKTKYPDRGTVNSYKVVYGSGRGHPNSEVLRYLMHLDNYNEDDVAELIEAPKLHVACVTGNMDMIKAEIRSSSDEPWVNWGLTYKVAGSAGNIDVADYLCAYKLEHIPDLVGGACRSGHVHVLRRLSEKYDLGFIVRNKTQYNEYLDQAIQNDFLPLFCFLLEAMPPIYKPREDPDKVRTLIVNLLCKLYKSGKSAMLRVLVTKLEDEKETELIGSSIMKCGADLFRRGNIDIVQCLSKDFSEQLKQVRDTRLFYRCICEVDGVDQLVPLTMIEFMLRAKWFEPPITSTELDMLAKCNGQIKFAVRDTYGESDYIRMYIKNLLRLYNILPSQLPITHEPLLFFRSGSSWAVAKVLAALSYGVSPQRAHIMNRYLTTTTRPAPLYEESIYVPPKDFFPDLLLAVYCREHFEGTAMIVAKALRAIERIENFRELREKSIFSLGDNWVDELPHIRNASDEISDRLWFESLFELGVPLHVIGDRTWYVEMQRKQTMASRCRIVIYRHLVNSAPGYIDDKIEALRLPQSLKRYLHFEDFKRTSTARELAREELWRQIIPARQEVHHEPSNNGEFE